MLYRVKIDDAGSLWTKTVYVAARNISEAAKKAAARIKHEKHGVIQQIVTVELVDAGF